MIQYMHIDPKLEKQLKALRQAGKKAALAVDRAENIISRLKEGVLRPEQIGTVTKHGELRIKGCMKYNLGSGYRLVTYKEEQELFILFAGTHDDCHRWIENNRDLPLEDIRRRSQHVPIEAMDHPNQYVMARKQYLNGEEGDDSFEQPDDHQLRILFSGLIQSVQS